MIRSRFRAICVVGRTHSRFGRCVVAVASALSQPAEALGSRRARVGAQSAQTGTTARVSKSTSGAQANNFSGAASVSADGRYVAFESAASNLVPGDTNGQMDVFVRGPLS